MSAPTFRAGGSWRRKGHLCTVVLEGGGPPDGQGRRPGDRLVGVMATPELAEFAARALTDTAAASGDDLLACALASLPERADEDVC